MNKNLVLISSISLLLIDVCNLLRIFFLHEAMKILKHGGVIAETIVVRIIIFVIKRKCQQEE
jgi:hypothetical protein